MLAPSVNMDSYRYIINRNTHISSGNPPNTMSTKTIAFLGATGGCGLSALRLAVAAGYICVVLCRTPAKMDVHFPEKLPNLIVMQGDAHDTAAISKVLIKPSSPATMVDAVNFSIGGNVRANLTMYDPDVCKKGMTTLLEAIAALRSNGVVGRPLIAVVSTTGISKHGRDFPLLFIPMYHIGLKAPHADKRAMEKSLYGSSERFVLVRPSLLQKSTESSKNIRVHIEGESGIERKEIGYFISREDVGQWMFENLLMKADQANKFERKAVGLTW